MSADNTAAERLPEKNEYLAETGEYWAEKRSYEGKCAFLRARANAHFTFCNYRNAP